MIYHKNPTFYNVMNRIIDSRRKIFYYNNEEVEKPSTIIDTLEERITMEHEKDERIESKR